MVPSLASRCRCLYCRMFQLSNKKSARFVCAIYLSTLFLLPASTYAQSAEQQYQTVLQELIRTLHAQILVLQIKLAEQTKTEQSATKVTPRPTTVFDNAPVLKRYQIGEPSDVKTVSNLDHRKYLERIYEIFPDKYDNKIKEFTVFKDKNGEFGAFVETLPPDNVTWSFAVNSELLGKENTSSNSELIVHELAHIISYEEIAGLPLPGTATCDSYFKNQGCPKNNSYISSFVDEFWGGDDLDRATSFRAEKSPVDAAYDYFESLQKDEYVSGYAALSPEEDFAESFAQYVMNRAPRKDTVLSDKVWWFDQFTELKDARRSIQNSQ
jgi:hypothetical protein